MPIFSALDSVSPAFGRTKLVLFTPFRAGRTWKLCITAYLGVVSTVFMPMFLLVFFFLSKLRQVGGSTLATSAAVAAVLMTLLFTWIFYLCTRLRFSYFDIVLNRGEFVAPAWRKYGPQAWKWTLCKVVFGTALTALAAVPTAAFLGRFIATVSKLKPGEQPPPDFIFGLMSGYFTVYLLFILFFWLSSLLSDFIVPSLALENTTLGEAFRRLCQLIRTEPGQFTAYAFAKLGLAIGGYMGVTIAFEIALIVVGALLGLIVVLVGLGLHAAGVSVPILTVLGVFLLVAFYIFAFWALMFGYGAVLTFLEAYTLYFLSGRYPMLGELLAASTLPPSGARGLLYPDPYPPYVPPVQPD